MKRARIAALTLAAAVAAGTTALAAGGMKDISVLSGMKVLINGEEFVPHDVTGKEVEVFAYEGTTYVPIRAVSEAFGLDVDYDADQQAAVISGELGGGEAEPVLPSAAYAQDVCQVLSCAPETYLDDEGKEQTYFYDVEWYLSWMDDDQGRITSAKLVDGELPEGIELTKEGFFGTAQGEADTMVTVHMTRENGDEWDQKFHFKFYAPDELAAVDVVITGFEGDGADFHVDSIYDGLLWPADLTGDFHAGDNFSKLSHEEADAALAELEKYGLTFHRETRTDDGEWYYGDNYIDGILTGRTDGWVKISIPVYGGGGVNTAIVERTGRNVDDYVKDGELQPVNWWVTGDDMRVVGGYLNVYLNIIGYGG